MLTHLSALTLCIVGFTDAEYDAKLAEVRNLLAEVPDEELHLVVEPPFVVVGNEDEATVRRHAASTVRWAVRLLRADYFAEDPAEILVIWLFGDADSYQRLTAKLFGDHPDTPYGYYSSRHGALIMNIATGGGTLVHEIVHPFVAANFPGCPSWLNEGLGSLYEQSGEREGHIVGFTNWRLAGLQQAIRARKLPSFRELCATTDDGFYSEDPGTHYAQARYLLYYLQEQGALSRFYHAFRAARGRDPTGYATLMSVLGTDDMEAFQRAWESWVLRLRFP
jgi:hypothetical protein